MAFNNEDLRGELFDKLGVKKTEDPVTMLKQAENEQKAGNNHKAKQLFNQVIDQTSAQATRYESQNQHRSAAEALYINALAHEKLENTEERDRVYNNVVDQLLAASKTALTFDENTRGITSATLAGLVCLMYGNETRAFEIYNKNMETAETKPDGETLKKLLYSLGYLLDALKNTNIGALTDAQNYISTDLKPMLSTTKLEGFQILLDTVVKHTQSIVERKITMPKIQLNSKLPKDIQFNQIFEMEIAIKNSGDGVANNAKFTLEIPDDIEILDGKTEESIDSIPANTGLTRTLSLRLLTGDTSSGLLTKEIKGELIYEDMLGNSHKQYFGPLSIEFTSISKKEEYTKKLDNVMQEIGDEEEKTTPEEVPTIIKQHAFNLPSSLKDQIQAAILEEKFEQSEFGIELLKSVKDWITDVTGETEFNQTLSSQIINKIENEKSEQKEELTAKFKKEKEEALTALEKEKEETKQLELEKQKTELESKYRSEINQLKEDHNSELQQIHTSHENKVRQKLTQLENKLKEEFRKEMDKKNEETENAIREMQTQERKSVEEAVNKTREELKNKYESKIDELQNSMEEMRRQLTQRADEEKAIELKTLRSKLEQEKKDALEQQERVIEERVEGKYQVEIEDLKKENQRLKDKISELEGDSSSSDDRAQY